MDGQRVNESDAKLEEHWGVMVGQVSSPRRAGGLDNR
jgi:hypothetical protein